MGRLDWKQISRHISGSGGFTGSLNISGSSTFIGTQNISGSLIPEALSDSSGLFDLGSAASPWRDLYLTTASLKFVRQGEVVATMTGESDAIRIGNILITTSSLSVVSGSGDSLTVVKDVVKATVNETGQVTSTEQELAPDGTVSSSAQITALGFISSSEGGNQTLSFNSVSNSLTISSGNSVDLSSLAGGGGGGSSIWSTGSDFYRVSANLKVTGSLHATSLTGSLAFSNLEGTPVIVSSSGQITGLGFISGSPDGTISSSAQVQNVVTNSYISASAAASGFGSGTVDISSLNTFSGSIQSQVNSLKVVTGSYATTGSNNFSGDQSIDGTIDVTGQENKIRFHYNNLNDLPSANTYHGMFAHVHATGKAYFAHNGAWVELAKANTYVPNTATGSFVTSDQTGSFVIPAGTISSSVQISASAAASGFGAGSAAAGTVSSSAQIISGLAGSGVISSSAQIPFSTATVATASYALFAISASHEIVTEVSSSHAVTADTASFVSSTFLSSSIAASGFSFTTTDLPSGVLSSSAQLPSGLISSSAQVSASAAASGFSSATLPSGVISSSAQVSASAAASGFGSGGGGSVAFDGDKIVSNTLLGDLYSNNFNPGTDGTIQDFLNAVFFPNTSPTISTGNQEIVEFTTSGSLVTILTGSDAEGQSFTFGTSSLYTADFFRVDTAGSMSLNTLATASMNTENRGDGTLAHPVIVTATDTFNGTTNKTIYVRIDPNTAPVFRQSSVAGSIITSFTTARNENATPGEVTKIYFTDVDSDAITITSSSIAGNDFSITKYATYVSIAQVTASLDFETTSSYSFSITASDEHNVAGVDGDSFTTLPITINVTDNVIPTINNQTFTGFSEDENDGDSSKDIAATDPEGDTIVFTNFTLAGLALDGTPVSIGTYSGTSQSDPDEDPFQMNSAGRITRKDSQYINSDLINRYIYSASVSDVFNSTTNSAAITLDISDDVAPSISANGAFYIIESALTGNFLTTATSGIAGTRAAFNVTNGQSVTFSVAPALFNINSSGQISLASNVSASFFGGATLTGSVTASNSFGTTAQTTFNVSVTDNQAPSITATAISSNLNTNSARPNTGNNLYQLTFSDPEGDAIALDKFTFSGTAGLVHYINGSNVFVSASSNLAAGAYAFTASISDSGSFATNTNKTDFSIAQAGIGTLGGDTTSHIIESAISGAVLRDASGFGAGNASQLTVSYSPQYESAAVASFTSSNAAIAVDNSGNLTLAVNLSGSATSSGATISTNITYRDQFDNIGSGSVTVNVFANQAPSVSAIDNSGVLNTNQANTGVTIQTVTISDTESDVPFAVSLTGADASKFNIVPQNANTSSLLITAAEDLAGGSYNFNIVAVDNFDESTTQAETVSIAFADIGTLTGNTTSHIIESALSGAVLRSATGFNNGSPADLSVSYSPNYGSQAVAAFTSSNASIAVSNTGALTLAVNLSGSATSSGDSISSTITYRDQYDNIGSGSISVNVFANQAPSATFTDQTANLTASISTNTNLVSVTISDTETDTPFSMSLAGQHASYLKAVPQNAISSSYQIQAASSITSSLNYSASIFDNFDETRNYNRSLDVFVPVFWYAFLDEAGAFAGNETQALSSYGDANDDGSTDSGTLFGQIAAGQLGTGTITTSAFAGLGATKAHLIASGSILVGDRTSTFIEAVNHTTGSQSATGIVIVFPSASLAGNGKFTLPTAMATSVGGSANGEYVLFADRIGTGVSDSPQSAFVRYLDFSAGVTYPNTSINKFGAIFSQVDTTADINYFFMASSGSAPSSTQ